MFLNRSYSRWLTFSRSRVPCPSSLVTGFQMDSNVNVKRKGAKTLMSHCQFDIADLDGQVVGFSVKHMSYVCKIQRGLCWVTSVSNQTLAGERCWERPVFAQDSVIADASEEQRPKIWFSQYGSLHLDGLLFRVCHPNVSRPNHTRILWIPPPWSSAFCGSS